MHKKLTALVLSAALLVPAAFSAAPALAQEENGRGRYFFERFDADNDQRVTLEEFTNGRNALFDEADANDDGFIDRDERRAAWQTRRQMRMQHIHSRIDADNDGNVSEEEFLARHRERFSQLDADNDGNISQAEMEAAWRERMERRQAHRAERGERRGDGWRHHRRYGGHHHRGGWRRADANGDGKISRNEFDLITPLAFARLDENEDGAITADELPRGGRWHRRR